MLNTDSTQRNAVIGCSRGFSHVQRDFSWGDDRLLGTALSQTRSISALSPLRAGSCSALFRGVMQRKCENFQRVSCLPLIYILLKDDPSSIHRLTHFLSFLSFFVFSLRLFLSYTYQSFCELCEFFFSKPCCTGRILGQLHSMDRSWL